jgi:hypothetical protein
MGVLLTATLTALSINVYGKLGKIFDGTFVVGQDLLQLLFGILLFALAIMVAVQGINKLREKPAE